MNKIFIVEDNKTIRDELAVFLEKNGYKILTTTKFDHIVSDILKAEPEMVLLDINLPVVDGFYICSKLREKSQVPIIILTSRDTDVDELMSMNLGADDFITKPYNPYILLARIQNILKRKDGSKDYFRLGDSKFIFSKGELITKDKTISLTKNEEKILYKLCQNIGETVSRDELMVFLWESDEFIDDNTLTVNVNRLRKTLEQVGLIDVLETKRGRGYLLRKV